MDIEDSPEYKECKIENGKKYKKVQQEDGSWVWVLDVAGEVLGVVIDIATIVG